MPLFCEHDDVIKWEHFPRYWPFVRGIQRSPVNSPHKGQWREALMFSLICAWINDGVNNREVGDFRRHRVHYDVTAMISRHLFSKELRKTPHWSPVNAFNIVLYSSAISLALCLRYHALILSTWWRHQMETFSALLALCAGNSPVTGEFPSQRPVTRSFDVFFDE